MFSDLPPKADIDRRDGYVRFVPEGDHSHHSEQTLYSITALARAIGVR
jgi:hypothetical protein